jgi:hypothetical protein
MFAQGLRFGDGALLLDGTGDYPGRLSLKGRHIVRVGWDDVRGWFAEVRGTQCNCEAHGLNACRAAR